MTKTVIGTYRDMQSAVDVVNALVRDGYDRDTISIIANDPDNRYSGYLGRDVTDSDVIDNTDDVAKGAGIGALLGGLGGLLVGLGALAIPGIGPVIAAGPIAAALAGAGIGAVAGGIMGALVDLGIPESEAQVYAESVRRGNVLVAIQVMDNHVDNVSRIMQRSGLIDIERNAEEWRAGGWKSFDPAGSAYTGNGHSHSGDRNYAQEPRQDAIYQSGTGTGTRTQERGTATREKPAGERINELTGDVRVRSYARPASMADPVPRGEADFGAAPTTPTHQDYATYDVYDPDFRTHYDTAYAQLGAGYEVYQPAYRYGYTLATDERYHDRSWNEIEPEVRRAWESRNEGTWDSFKDAVEHAWNKVRGRA